MKLQPRSVLVAAGVVFLPVSLRAAPEPAVLAGLTADSLKERARAQAALLDWAKARPDPARAWLLERVWREPDPEARRRCRAVLRELVIADYLKAGKGYVGIMMQAVPVQLPGDAVPRFGVRVVQIVPGSPAAQAGLVAGDTIIGVDDQVWREPAADQEFSRWVQARPGGGKVTLRLWRNGGVVPLPLVLGRRPEGDAQAGDWSGPGAVERMDRESRDRYFERWLEERKPRP